MTHILKPLKMDGRAKALHNDLTVLKLVYDFGHLRRADIAEALWGYSSESSAQQMAQRTVLRLLEQKVLVERVNALGTKSVLLTKKGANVLRSHGTYANSTTDSSSIGGSHFYHRCLSTSYLISRLKTASTVYGELALIRGADPVGKAEFLNTWRKIPDGLVVVRAVDRGYEDDFTHAADWVEVESSYKDRGAVQSMLDVAWQIGSPLDSRAKIVLARMVFVYNREQGHEAALMRGLVKRLVNDQPADVPHVLKNILFVRADVALPLSIKGFETVTAHDLLMATNAP